jgi:hypothetical protein
MAPRDVKTYACVKYNYRKHKAVRHGPPSPPPATLWTDHDHRSLEVDLLRVARRVGTTTHQPPSLIGYLL